MSTPFTLFTQQTVRSIRRILSWLEQADSAWSAGDQRQVTQTLSYAFRLPDIWPDTRELLLTTAPKMEQAGHRDEWMPYLERAIQHSQQVGDTATGAELQLQLGILHQLRSHYDQARHHLSASATTFETLSATDSQARALNRLAYVARLERQLDEAEQFVATALQQTSQDSERAYGYYVLALVALDKRAWQEAVDWCQQALGPRPRPTTGD